MQNDYNGAERRRQAWHLDRRVPLAIFIVLLGQMLSGVWYASEINSAVKKNAQDTAALSSVVMEMQQRERENGKLVERVVRVETIMENVLHTVNKIDDSLNAYTDRRHKK